MSRPPAGLAMIADRGVPAESAAPAAPTSLCERMTELSIDEFGADIILDEFLDSADGSNVNVDALTDPIAACVPGSTRNPGLQP